MNERTRLIVLVLIMVTVSLIVAGIAIFSLYAVALEEERARLVETATSQARLIEAIASFDSEESADFPGGPEAATLSQIRNAHQHTEAYFGETGEFTLAQREGDQIVFLLDRRHDTPVDREAIPFDSDLAEPMRRALTGHSGTVIGLDYRGETVLAAHEPVRVLNYGIVAKIDLAEIRAPFVRIGVLSGLTGLFVVLAGSLLFLRTSNPLIRRLRKSEARIRTIVESAADVIITVDDRGVIESCSTAIENIFRWRPEDVIGERIFLLLPQMGMVGASHELPDHLSSYSRNPGEVVGELEGLRKDGSTFPVEIAASEMRLGTKRLWTAVIRDISKRKAAEIELRQVNRDLEQKALELEQLIYVTSHDLRSPLVNIQGFSKELDLTVEEIRKLMGEQQRTPEVDAKISQMLLDDIPTATEFIKTSTLRMGALIEGLLKLSRLGRTKLTVERLDMNEIVRQVAESMEFQINQQAVSLQIHDLPRCLGDEIGVGQVFSNLVDNALKYSDPTRTITIDVSGRVEDGYATYCVKDNGIGISPG